MCLHFAPDHQKVTQTLNYLANKSGGQINKMKALKLLFFADRYHLRNYGRPVSGDQYWAMKQGPVASMALNLADNSELDDVEREYLDRFLSRSENKYVLCSVGQVDEDVFSDSDLEALEFAWATFGHLDKWTLVELTHAYPEWNKHEPRLGEWIRRARMEYADFFLDPRDDEPLLAAVGNEDPFALSEADKQQAFETAHERARIEALWG